MFQDSVEKVIKYLEDFMMDVEMGRITVLLESKVVNRHLTRSSNGDSITHTNVLSFNDFRHYQS